MHELPVTKSILNICIEELDRHNMDRVLKINLKIGELTGLIPETIEYYFNIIAEGTKAENARIISQKIPVEVSCKNCGNVFEARRGVFSCLECNSHDIKITGGRDFLIDTIEME